MPDPLRIVSVSGGKDSTAVALIANERPELCRFVFADTGNEHELTTAYVQDYMPRVLGAPIVTVRANFDERIANKRRYVETMWPQKGVPQSIIDAALSVLHPTGNPFLDLCLWKGRFPSRMAQFCTQELKRRVLDEFLLRELEAGHEVESWRGVRRDESLKRRNAPARELVAEGWAIVHPIVDWTAQRVVDFVRGRGVELNRLYTMGMGRVGCMPCINCGKDELLSIASRFPDHVARIREWERLVGMAAKRGRSSFFTERAKTSSVARPGWVHVPAGVGDDGELEPEHWSEPMQETFGRCQIDARIEWAKTSRGAKQLDMLRAQMPPAECSSLYGLCE